jgi:spore photoproduct lyase
LIVTIDTLFIDRALTHEPVVAALQARIPAPVIWVDGAREVYQCIERTPDPIQQGKQSLYLTLNRGAYLKHCPGTQSYHCCGYKILNIGAFCTMDCAYCILQAYFHPPVLQYYVNHADLFDELKRVLTTRQVHRIGTGEFTDSLIWEAWSDLNHNLIRFFGRQSCAVLELKTKTVAIRRLQALPHRRKTIMAWSLNSPRVISTEERGTASLGARLRAAADCARWGYPLAFHFDPLIIYPGCEEEYRQVIQQLFKAIAPDQIVWISLGSFRFMPALKPIIEQRFSDSDIVYGEFIRGLDGKMRYFKPLRIALYQKMVAWIRSVAPELTIYFCMEDDEVWRKSLGFVPSDTGGVARMLDRSAMQHCELDPHCRLSNASQA